MNKGPQKNVKGNKPNLFALLIPYKGLLALLILFTLIGNGVNLVIPQLIAGAIDSFTDGNYVLQKVLVQFLTATVLIFIFSYFQQILQTYAAERVAFDIRAQLSDKIARQSYAFIQKANPSKLLTNLTSDIDAVKMFVSMAVTTIFSSLIIIVGTCILLLTINWHLALLVITMVPIMMGIFAVVLKKLRPLFTQSREVIDWLNKVINESILGAAIIRVVNSQQAEYNKFLEANTKAKSLGISILTLFATLIPVITFVSNLAILAVLLMGGHFVILSKLSMGEFAAFNSYIAILIFPIIMIGFMGNVMAQASASYQRIHEVLNASETADKGAVKAALSGAISLQGISVYYKGKPALKEVGLQLKPGTKNAIIGPTAAGKTQLLYVLSGLVKPETGQVSYDGHPLNELEKEGFHNQVGFVFQDSILFNLSLRDNIAFNEQVSESDLAKAIETADLADYIAQLPKQLDTIVSERGTSLSGGQKQRIMLARALALNPKILFLDDFTARVDRQTEEKILQNVQRNYPDLTLLSVTQKIDPIKHFDQIVLLMEGEVVAVGQHQELLATSPEYNQIYNSQKSTSHYELQS